MEVQNNTDVPSHPIRVTITKTFEQHAGNNVEKKKGPSGLLVGLQTHIDAT